MPALIVVLLATAPDDGWGEASPLALTGVSAGLGLLVVTGGTLAWWREGGFVGWSWKHTGAFGEHTYAGGADKLGHFFSVYAGTRATAAIYRTLGVPPDRALIAGAAFAFLMSNVVEVVDGFTAFGFEYGDLIANTLGMIVALAAESLPGLDALVGVRLGYWPSPAFLERDKSYIRLINDYSGMTFYFDLRAAGLVALGADLPAPLSYLLAGVNYGALDYAPRGDRRSRKLGVHLGVDLAAFFDGPLRTLPRYYAVPFTLLAGGAELNRGGGWLGAGVPNRFELR